MEKLYTLKTFLKMAGGKMDTPHPTPLDPPLAISYENHQKSLIYFSYLAPSVLFFFIRRRRRLAGHLFQDRWKNQGRGFILLPPWPPNCLGQMLTVRDFSQHLVSSSKTIRPNIPRGARCMGHCEMM